MNKIIPRFSIIIPVYNVEKYISECVDSVLNQHFDDCEVILVDDGSEDRSGCICDDYAAEYENIYAFHKKNGGLSSARNYGIDKAKGEYLVFIDSDDYWNENTFLHNVSDILSGNSDMILFGYGELKDNVFVPKIDFPDLSFNKIYDLQYVVTNSLVTSSACTKIVKREIVTSNNIYFRYGVTSEDIEWTAKLLTCCKSYSVYAKPVYVYRQRDTSITHSIEPKAVYCLFENIKYTVDIFQQCNFDNKEPLYNYAAYQYITLLNLYVRFITDDKPFKLELKKLKWLLFYHQNKKVKTVYLFNKVFGFDVMLKILRMFLLIKKNGR